VIKMARGPRILLDNMYYHIIARGNQKQKIFLEDSDFEEYLRLLKHFKRKYGLRLLGYCLMPNHVHMILESKEANHLVKFMQGLTQTYTMWFNQKYKKAGHLWQGRFKNMLIYKDDYFLECIYYVENNPVRAGLVSSPINYYWSSYRTRVLGNKGSLLDLPDST
jgi:putative transposase